MKSKYLIPCLLIIYSVYSCEDFIEKDIKKKTVNILAPGDNLHTDILTQIFWWDELDGAEEYRLQIVLPSFSSIQTLILDTLLVKDKFTFTFPYPGNFQWRIKALNNGSETDFSTRSLFIDSTLDLTNQTVNLEMPLAGFNTKDSTITFKWQPLYSATEYRIVVIDNINTNTVIDSTLAETEVTLSLSEGSYLWKINAINTSSQSTFSSRNLTIDLTPPIPPHNLVPAYGDTVSNPITLSWVSETGSAGDSIFIYPDTNMTSISASDFVQNYLFSYTGVAFQIYYWKVKSIDQAGNEGSFTPLSKFVVQ